MDKKQNTGHWITMYESKNMVACSKCNKCAYLYNGRTSAYCPHCGDYKGQAQADGEITDDDIATMRILFNADIECLCNQGRFNDAKEMEQIRDRLMASLQADGDIITALCSLPKIISEDGQDYVQLFDVLKTVKRYTAKADDGMREATPEERESVDKYIKSISKPTGIYCDRNICLRNEYNNIGCDECEVTKSQEPSGGLISRVEAIKAIDEKAKRIKNADTLNGLAGAVGILFDLPSVKLQEPKMEQFAKWVASEIFDEWEYNKDTFAEIACRKLAKLGIVRAKGDEWELVDQQESDHTCHTCKHYTSGERDGSCGSYICKGYSNLESEE